jgi:hypothetical protein
MFLFLIYDATKKEDEPGRRFYGTHGTFAVVAGFHDRRGELSHLASGCRGTGPGNGCFLGAGIDSIGGTLWRTLALFGQYFVPFLCLIGAGLSALRRNERAVLLDGVAKTGDTHALNAMSWQEFERMVGEWFRRQGYSAVEVGGGGADGGIDLGVCQRSCRVISSCLL